MMAMNVCVVKTFWHLLRAQTPPVFAIQHLKDKSRVSSAMTGAVGGACPVPHCSEPAAVALLHQVCASDSSPCCQQLLASLFVCISLIE